MATTSKITKEQLAIEVVKLQESHANWIAQDERRRREFAKAFNWGKPVGMIGANHMVHEPTTPSWEEIYVQIGKLLILSEKKNEIPPLPPIAFPIDMFKQGL